MAKVRSLLEKLYVRYARGPKHRGHNRLVRWIGRDWIPSVTTETESGRMILEPDDLIQCELLIEGHYERATCDLHRKLLRPGDIYLDVGANAGVYTLLASQCVGPTGRVIAVEPNPATFVCLLKNLGLNEFASNVQPVACAVWSSPGFAHLSVPPVNNCGLARLVDTKADGSIAVCTQPISMLLEFIGVPAPDVMKIDIEGNEYEVLREMLDSGVRPRHIVTEYLPDHFHGHRMLPGLLRDRGYDVHSVSGGPLEDVIREDSNLWAAAGDARGDS